MPPQTPVSETGRPVAIDAGPSRAPAAPPTDEPSLAEIVRFLRRRGAWILVGALLGGAAALTTFLFLVPQRYSATATLVVQGPSLSSELAPGQLSVQGYQTMLESDAVVAESRQALIDSGDWDPERRLEIGHQLSSRIFVARRQETTSLAPLIEARVETDSPEIAALLANTWASVFLRHARDLVVGATSPAVDFVEEQFPKSQRELAEAEDRWLTAASDFQKLRADASTRWDQRIATSKRQTVDLIAQFHAETRATLEAFLDQMLRQAYDRGVTTAPVAEGRTFYEILTNLVAVRVQLAQINPVVTLEKAMSDDALWQSLVIENVNDADIGEVQERTLMTEEINPAYTELVLRAIELEGELKSHSVASGESGSAAAMELEKLQQERAAGLAKLRERRSLELTLLRREQLAELDAIDRERNVRMGQIRRELNQLKELNIELAGNYNDAVLAKAQEDVEQIRLALPAVPVDIPMARSLGVKTAAACLLGGLLGLLGALGREVVRASP